MEIEILDAKEVSKLLKINVQRVYELTRRGLLPTIYLGERQYRYSREQIEEFIKQGGNRNLKIGGDKR